MNESSIFYICCAVAISVVAVFGSSCEIERQKYEAEVKKACLESPTCVIKKGRIYKGINE